jgi:hypothetical protein
VKASVSKLCVVADDGNMRRVRAKRYNERRMRWILRDGGVREARG